MNATSSSCPAPHTRSGSTRLLPSAVVLVLLLAAWPAQAVPPIYVPWPCGVTYRVTQGHNQGSHTGDSAWAWDFGIPVGGEVAAPADGVVSHIRMNQTAYGCDSAYSGMANYVIIQFADGSEAQLAHLQANSSTLKVGDRVTRGQVVGKVGLSGYVCGAHLHFKIQNNCSIYTCPSVHASFEGFGDPGTGTTITSNNCGGGGASEAALMADAWDRDYTDIDGDGLADVCGRAAAGVACLLSSGAALDVSITGPELSNATGWDDLSNYSTLRMADINGDGLADLCARANAGMRCWPSTGNGFGAAIAGPDLSDTAGWNDESSYASIRMGDINGDGMTDLCGRAASGFVCYPSTGTGFGPAVNGPAMSDANGWNFPEHYTTIRMGDVNGDGRDDVCGRSNVGYYCWLSDGTSLTTRIDGPVFGDTNGWSDTSNYTTIRLADIDGNGMQDICARANADFRCYPATGTGFGGAVVGPTLSDASGWGDIDNYATIRMGDLDGDGRDDLCARANAGMRCWRSTGTGFDATAITGPDWSDANGWDDASAYRTIRLADVTGDGLGDLCGRGSAGVECWASNGAGFPTRIPGPAWTDASNWNREQYYSTIRFGGARRAPACTPSTEVCDGLDNDCNGQIDEGGVCAPVDTGSDTTADTGGDTTSSTDTSAASDTVSGSDTSAASDTWAGRPDAAADTSGTLSDAPGPGVDVGNDALVDAAQPDGGAGEHVVSDCACSVTSPQRRHGIPLLLGCFGLFFSLGRLRRNRQ